MSTTEKLPALWEIEADLAVWTDTAEGESVPAELQAEFAAILAEKSERAIAKRERVIEFIIHCEKEMEKCKEREECARARRKQIESGLEKFRKYVAGVVNAHGQQKPKQSTKTLACPLGVLRAQRGPAKVAITDEDAVPMRYKRATVHFEDASDWAWIVNQFDQQGVDFAKPGTWRAEFEVSLKRVGEALDAGEDVPGADRDLEGELFLKLS